SPLEWLEHALHPWVAFAILPLFAFANAGLALGDFTMEAAFAALPLGVLLGLVLGKPIGITLAALAMRATGRVRWPEGMDFKAMLGMGLLCGIGFTMSLFIASLAYTGLHYEESVLGILSASVIASLLGLAWLRAALPAPPETRGWHARAGVRRQRSGGGGAAAAAARRRMGRARRVTHRARRRAGPALAAGRPDAR